MKKSLLNKKQLRDYILAEIKKARPGWDCTRVSPSAIREIELRFKRSLAQMIHMHPTRGKTFKEIF